MPCQLAEPALVVQATGREGTPPSECVPPPPPPEPTPWLFLKGLGKDALERAGRPAGGVHAVGRRGQRTEHRGPCHAHVVRHCCRQAAERGAGMPSSCSGPSDGFRAVPGMWSP